MFLGRHSLNVQPTQLVPEKRILWLDLEDTIITPILQSWNRFDIINLEKILAIKNAFKPDLINIFSFAIWDEFQLKAFSLHCQPHLEKAIDCSFNLIPTVDGEIIPFACSVLNLAPSQVDFSDASAFWSKHESFRLLLRRLHQFDRSPKHHILLDDAVEDEDFCFPRLGIIGQTINIDLLSGI